MTDQTMTALTAADVSESTEMENMFSNYMVMDTDGINMTVEYTDGERAGEAQTLEINGQLKVYNRIVKERAEEAVVNAWRVNFKDLPAAKIKSIEDNIRSKISMRTLDLGTSADTYFTLGFLSRNAKLVAEVGHYYLQAFKDEYLGKTGEQVAPYIPQNKPNQLELRIFFKTPSEDVQRRLSFPSDVRVRDYGADTRINNCALFWSLIGYGSKMGRRHSRMLREAVPDQYKASFDIGLAA